MLLNGLRSREVLALQLETSLFSQAQIRVHGKGARVRLLPLPPETIRILQCYLKTERPLTIRGRIRFLKGGLRHSHDTGRIALLIRHHAPPAASASQSASVPPHIWIGHDTRRSEFARAAAPDGSRSHSHHAALHFN